MISDPGAVVRAAFERLNEHDLDGYYGMLSEDVTYTGLGTTRGRDAARAADAVGLGALPDHWRRVDRLLVCGNTVAAWLTFGGTPAGSGTPIEVEFCDIFEIRNGEIQSLTMYADWPSLLRHIGA